MVLPRREVIPMYDSEKLDNALFAVVCALRGIDRDLAAMCEILGRIDQRQAE